MKTRLEQPFPLKLKMDFLETHKETYKISKITLKPRWSNLLQKDRSATYTAFVVVSIIHTFNTFYTKRYIGNFINTYERICKPPNPIVQIMIAFDNKIKNGIDSVLGFSFN